MLRGEIIQGLSSHMLSEDQGWRYRGLRPEFASADIAAEDSDGTVWIFAIAEGTGDGDDVEGELCRALGRLILAMPREYSVNSFNVPRPDPSYDPPLMRHVLTVADTPEWRRLLLRIPKWVRLRLRLTFAFVSSSQVTIPPPWLPVAPDPPEPE